MGFKRRWKYLCQKVSQEEWSAWGVSFAGSSEPILHTWSGIGCLVSVPSQRRQGSPLCGYCGQQGPPLPHHAVQRPQVEQHRDPQHVRGLCCPLLHGWEVAAAADDQPCSTVGGMMLWLEPLWLGCRTTAVWDPLQGSFRWHQETPCLSCTSFKHSVGAGPAPMGVTVNEMQLLYSLLGRGTFWAEDIPSDDLPKGNKIKK